MWGFWLVDAEKDLFPPQPSPFDGAFWMSFDDFARSFDRIDVCDRSAHRDLRLDTHEDEGTCGACKGCMLGCMGFWCLCRGVRTLYFSHRSTPDVEYEPPICRCGRDTGRGWVDDSGLV